MPEASLEGWSGRFRPNDELQERRPRPPPRPSRGPRPLRRLLRASRRPTGPLAERWCALGTFPLKPKRALKNTLRGRRCASTERRSSASPAAGAGAREPLGTPALANNDLYAVRGRVGQSPSIHLEPARCRRDARDPILIEEAQRALPRRHAPPEGRRARRLAHGVAGHDVVGFALAAAVPAAAGAVLRGR